MKKETIKALDELCNALGTFAYGCLLTIGIETATHVVAAAEQLRKELKNENVDPTNTKTE